MSYNRATFLAYALETYIKSVHKPSILKMYTPQGHRVDDLHITLLGSRLFLFLFYLNPIAMYAVYGAEGLRNQPEVNQSFKHADLRP